MLGRVSINDIQPGLKVFSFSVLLEGKLFQHTFTLKKDTTRYVQKPESGRTCDCTSVITLNQIGSITAHQPDFGRTLILLHKSFRFLSYHMGIRIYLLAGSDMLF